VNQFSDRPATRDVNVASGQRRAGTEIVVDRPHVRAHRLGRPRHFMGMGVQYEGSELHVVCS
jgi:hypothetical protein